MGLFSGGGGDVNIPDFVTDPAFMRSQRELEGLSTGILRGDIPEYYQAIGDVQGEPIQRARRELIAGIVEASEGAVAGRGLGTSPAGLDSIAKAVQSGLTTFDLNTLLQTIQGKQFLLTSGMGGLGNVASRGLTYAGQENQYNLGRAKLEAEYAGEEEDPLGDILAMAGGAISGGMAGAGGGWPGILAGGFAGAAGYALPSTAKPKQGSAEVKKTPQIPSLQSPTMGKSYFGY